MNFKFIDISDTTISFNFSKKIDQNINSKIIEISSFINKNFENLNIKACFPTYNSLIIDYDPLKIERLILKLKITELIKNFEFKNSHLEELFQIDVSYGGNNGEDLNEVSKIINISEKEIVKIHSSTIYHVFMIGFSPGFPYLGGLDKRLICPRLKSPRQEVPAGSVGIADRQTGIYPFKSSGGWRLIGKTDEKLFDYNLNSPSIIKPGMKLKFNEV
tara:strand:- start:505 stop:1155 length:651 start_codon:yes stop_codon:yes gene_type:complete